MYFTLYKLQVCYSYSVTGIIYIQKISFIESLKSATLFVNNYYCFVAPLQRTVPAFKHPSFAQSQEYLRYHHLLLQTMVQLLLVSV